MVTLGWREKGGGGESTYIELALLLSLRHLLEKLVDLAVDITGNEAGIGGNGGWNPRGGEPARYIRAM